MTAERLLRIITAVSGDDSVHVDRLCGACADVIGVAGVGATVSVDGGPPAALRASNAVAERIEDLQNTLGEGPGIDAHRTGRPVGESDLDRPRTARWPMLAGQALAEGAAALFAFPLRLGGVRLGALTLYQPWSGRLSDAQHADALAMADLVLQIVLGLQAGAAPGALAVDLEPLNGDRAEVHQAAGMVSVQLSVSVAEALTRLRGRAFAEDRPLAELAADIVDRRLRFAT
jgi:hypothetical protein